jgi:hypothetical protein
MKGGRVLARVHERLCIPRQRQLPRVRHQLSSTDSTVGLAASFGHANTTATRPFMP